MDIIQPVKHAFLRTFSVVCVLLVIAGLSWAIYRTFIKPPKTESYAQRATNISNVEYNYDYTEKEFLFLGIRLWKFRIGVSVK